MKDLAARMYVQGENDSYAINQALVIDLKTDQERCALLVEVIHQWGDKVTMSCGGGRDGFGYKAPSTCGGCVSAQRLLRKIFGDLQRFHVLPFVEFHGDRQYSYRVDLLKLFAEHGTVAVKKRMDEMAEEKRREEQEKKRLELVAAMQKNEKELEKLLGETTVSAEARQHLLTFMVEKSIAFLVVVSPDIVVYKSDRSEYGGSGGIGYFDQVRVYYHGQTAMREWQWRDRYSERNDRHDLRVNSFGSVTMGEQDDRVTITVVLKNGKYGDRNTSFSFKRVEVKERPKLDEQAQAVFQQLVDEEAEKVLAEKKRLHEFKPQMLADYGNVSVILPSGTSAYKSYDQPRVKQMVTRPELSLAAFVVVEQIDHRGSDPQLRYELYLVDQYGCRFLTEDHAYEKREGSALISIVDLQPEMITVNTRSGKREIKVE